MTLERFIEALQGAQLDVGVENLLDALWLATRPVTLTVESSAEPPRAPGDSPPVRVPDGRPHDNKPPETPPVDPTKVSPTASSKQKQTTSVYAPGGARGEHSVKASPVALPAGRALTNRLLLTRALRPLRRRWPSRTASDLDEERTVNATAELDGLLFPVFRPRQERWYDADIVLEDDPAVDLWQDTMRDFRQMLWDTGAFRDVRCWRLRMPATPVLKPAVRKPPVLESPAGAGAPVRTLSGHGVRRLIFFATHGSSGRWRDGSYAGVLEPWARSSSVVLLHLLARNRWKRTPLGEPQGVCVAQEPGAVASSLRAERFWWTLPPADPKLPPIALPAVPLNPAAFGEWAYMQMARGRRCAVFLVDRQKPGQKDQVFASEEEPIDFDRAVNALREVSPAAFRLAVLLSSSAFTIPVARLIQEAKFGAESDQANLGEVLLSGLVFARAPEGARPDPYTTYYDFYPEARAILLRSLREADAESVSLTLQQRVSNYIEQIYGRAITFRALVPKADGKYDLPDWAQPFAQVGVSLLGLPGHEAPPAELFREFRKSAAPSIVRRAAGFAATGSPLGPDAVDADVWRALVDLRLIAQSSSGDWQFLPSIQPLLAELAAQQPLLGIDLLWVDEHTPNNAVESDYLKSIGAQIVDVVNTEQGVEAAEKTHFDVIISDMSRGEDSNAGLKLLRDLGSRGIATPVVIYAARLGPSRRQAIQAAGAFGCTNDPQELYDLVKAASANRPAPSVRPDPARDTILEILTDIFDPSRALELIERLEAEPAVIATEILWREPDQHRALSNHLSIVSAYSSAGVAQIFAVQGSELKILTVLINEDKPGADYSIASWEGLIGRAARSGQAVWVPDVHRDSGYILAEPSTASELTLPVIGPRSSAVAAVVNLEFAKSDALGGRQIEWLKQFCAPLAVRLPVSVPETFISVAKADVNFAGRLVRDLRIQGGIAANTLETWPDSRVNAADTLVVLISAQSLDSNGDYSVLPLDSMAALSRILPVVIGDSPLIDDGDFDSTDIIDCRSDYGAGLRRLRQALGQPDAPPVPKSTENRQTAFEFEVFYMTSRMPAKAQSGIPKYGAQRATQPAFGTCRVTIPDSHQMGKIETPSWTRLQFRLDPLKHFTIKGGEALPDERFFAQLAGAARSGNGQVMLFTHGFNNEFDPAVFRTAQLGYDLMVDAVSLLYSWPSQGKLAAYISDEASADWSALPLTGFLESLPERMPNILLHVCAKGMGCRPMLRALQTLASRKSAGLRLGQLIFLTPDIDVEVFRQAVPEIVPMTQRTTVYVSPDDIGLKAAKQMHGFDRAGAVIDVVPSVDIVEVTENNLGHSYFSEERKMFSDMSELLRHNTPPEKRPGLRARTSAGGTYWTLA